jgi:predicted aldo/keto reductase-like oxidoreductase
MEQVQDNLRICSQEDITANGMIPEDREFLTKVANYWRAKIKIDCTSCRYCMPCPQGVNIPGCFSLYNNASMFDTWKASAKTYKEQFIDKQVDASLCVECGACESVCPQQLEIIKTLKELHAEFERMIKMVYSKKPVGDLVATNLKFSTLCQIRPKLMITAGIHGGEVTGICGQTIDRISQTA